MPEVDAQSKSDAAGVTAVARGIITPLTVC